MLSRGLSERRPAAECGTLECEAPRDRVGWGDTGTANKHINLIKQATESDESGRDIYVHYLSRLG